ncbi:MAG: cadherin-like domain-containing protein, partial [Acidobacteriota bacterium]
FELYHPSGRASIGVRRFPGTASVTPPSYVQLIDWGNGEHISCRGSRGECLVTAGSDPANGWGPFEAELFLQRTDGTVLRLAHHRSTSCGYWVQPRGSVSRDGRYVIFASDWGRETGRDGCSGGQELGRGDVYIIDLRNERSNSRPVAAPDIYSANQGATLAVDAPGVLANDTDSDRDPLTARLISGPSRGSLTLNPDGSFSYRPDNGFTGIDSFTYRASDDSAQSDAATVTIRVSSFDVCLQDDASGDVMLLNSTTGDYRFTACNSGLELSGQGRVKIKKKGCVISLRDSQSDRDVRATFNNCRSKGSATITGQGRSFQITDSATNNNVCACR